MTSRDGSMDEMRTDLTDSDIERLLAGDAGPLAGVMADLRSRRSEIADPAVADRHVTAAAAAVRGRGTRRAVVAPFRSRDPLVHRRRRARRAPIAVAAALVLSLTVSLAAADLLPGPAQSAISGVAERVGLRLPDGDADTGGDERRPPADRSNEPRPDPVGEQPEPSLPPDAPPVSSAPPAGVRGAPTGSPGSLPPAGVPDALTGSSGSPPPAGVPDAPAGPPAEPPDETPAESQEGSPAGPPEASNVGR